MNLTTKAVLHHGEYILETPTSIGMFEITFLATHVPSGQTVVIKTLGNKLRQHSQFEQFKEQFQKLARRWRRCKHPHLVQVLDYFEEAGLPYLVIEHIKGQTLAQLIKTKALPEAKAIEWMRQVSEGVNVLHKAGLLHQDIKPENIVQRQDTDRVVLCHSITELRQQLKQIPDNLSFEGYAAPEQYEFKESPTKTTDIYALAATFYCLLMGHPPIPATVRAILPTATDEHRQLQNLEKRHSLSPEIKQAIAQGLELVPQKRPQTVEDWLCLLGKREQDPSIKIKTQDTITIAEAKNPNPDSLAENLVTTFKMPATAKKPQPPIAKTSHRQKSPLKALIITGAIAAAGGIGFGFALRLNSPNGAGSTLMHTEQSFPPTSNWPQSQPPAKVPL